MRQRYLIASAVYLLAACSGALAPPTPNSDQGVVGDTLHVATDGRLPDFVTIDSKPNLDLPKFDLPAADLPRIDKGIVPDLPPVDTVPVDSIPVDSVPVDAVPVDLQPSGDQYVDQSLDLPPIPDLPPVDSYVPPTWQVTVSPTTQHLHAVRKVGNKWITAGTIGTLLVNQGSGWATAVNPNQWTIHDIWNIDDNTVLLASNGGVVRYNWSSFTVDLGVTASAGIWGSSPTMIWSVANYKDYKYDGSTWTPIIAAPYSAVDLWGNSSTDVWAWGDGKVYHYDGSSWQSVFFTLNLTDMWGASAAEMWSTKKSPGGMHRFVSGGWIDYPIPGLTQDLNGVHGTSATNIYAVGNNGTMLHYDGAYWTILTVLTNKDLFAVYAADDGTVVAVGEGGTIIEYR